MQLLETSPLLLHDLRPDGGSLRDEVLAGLARPQKALPSKLLYDARGSELFEQICALEEYYPTRTELAILRRHVAGMARLLGPDCLLVEYGSGSGRKTRLLLDHLAEPAGYVPVDISRAALVQAAAEVATAYPHLEILPVCADYTRPFDLPRHAGMRHRRRGRGLLCRLVLRRRARRAGAGVSGAWNRRWRLVHHFIQGCGTRSEQVGMGLAAHDTQGCMLATCTGSPHRGTSSAKTRRYP